MKSSQYWLTLVAVLGAVYLSFVVWRKNHADAEAPHPIARTAHAEESNAADPPGKTVSDFQLIDQDGKPFDSASLKGKVWVASFFFVSCPGTCLRLNQALSGLQKANPDSDIRYVSITCDPEDDTPEELAKYAKHFEADPERWTFLTGDMKDIVEIGKKNFALAVTKEGHTNHGCVIDRKGHVRGRFTLTDADQVEMLKRLLAKVEAEEAPADSSKS